MNNYGSNYYFIGLGYISRKHHLWSIEKQPLKAGGTTMREQLLGLMCSGDLNEYINALIDFVANNITK